MKTMKTKLYIPIVILFAGLLFASCDVSNEDPDFMAPVISDFELGANNSHIAYVGSDIHIENKIDAEGKISTIDIEIHMEDESAGWFYEHTYDEFSGLLNTTFHKHVDIPADAAIGEYHFHFTVTDMAGNQTTVEEHLEIQENSDTEAPSLSITAAPAENEEFTTEQSITISGQVTDNVAMGGLLVALIRADDTEVTNETVIIMLLNYFQDTDEVEFEASINAGAENDNNEPPALIEGENAWRSGEYYILVRTWDSTGNISESQHYPITVSL